MYASSYLDHSQHNRIESREHVEHDDIALSFEEREEYTWRDVNGKPITYITSAFTLHLNQKQAIELREKLTQFIDNCERHKLQLPVETGLESEVSTDATAAE